MHLWPFLLSFLLLVVGACGELEKAPNTYQKFVGYTASYTVHGAPGNGGRNYHVDYNRTTGNVLITSTDLLDPSKEPNMLYITCSFKIKISIDSALDELEKNTIENVYNTGGPATLTDGLAMTFELFTSDTNRTVLIDTTDFASLPPSLTFLYNTSSQRIFQ